MTDRGGDFQEETFEEPQSPNGGAVAAPSKWASSDLTAKGERRAKVALRTEAGKGARTLWFNTGTLCNITCLNCYIESSPTNDRLVYLSAAEVAGILDQTERRDWPTEEIGFTGGEPFLNPEMIAIAEEALSRGYRALILTNAMKPMLRPRVKKGLLALKKRYGEKLILRVSLDHYTAARHEEERGEDTFEKAMTGLAWLSEHGFEIHVAGRTMWDEPEAEARAGYAALFRERGFAVDAFDHAATVLFPEMTPKSDPPEITEACWGILDKRPDSVMCASSRMVVKRKGAAKPVFLACTLLPYDPAFELGETAEAAERPVALKHPYCASFCVLGGGSCSG